MIEIAELVDRLPFAASHIEHIGNEAAAQRKNQRQRMLRHRIVGIIADVRHGDAMRLAIGLVDAVGAGRGDGDQFQLGELFKARRAQRHLVDDGNIGVSEAFDDLVGDRLLIFRVAMREIRLPHRDADRRAVEENDIVMRGLSHGRLSFFALSLWGPAWNVNRVGKVPRPRARAAEPLVHVPFADAKIIAALFQIDMKVKGMRGVGPRAQDSPEPRTGAGFQPCQKRRFFRLLLDENLPPVAQHEAAQIDRIALGMLAELLAREMVAVATLIADRAKNFGEAAFRLDGGRHVVANPIAKHFREIAANERWRLERHSRSIGKHDGF